MYVLALILKIYRIPDVIDILALSTLYQSLCLSLTRNASLIKARSRRNYK